jgi:hypothetical protein
MTLRSTIRLVATILFGTLFGTVGARAQASLAVPGVVIDRPPAVQNLIAKLKTTRPFAELEDKPTSCWEVPRSQPPLTGCRYLPGDLRITVVWSRQTLQAKDVWIEKSEPLAAAPFAWADLANSFHLLCPKLTVEQATAMAGEALDKMRDQWLKCDSPTGCTAVSRETDGASRAFRTRGSKCDLQLSEFTKDGAIRSTLWVSISATEPPRL